MTNTIHKNTEAALRKLAVHHKEFIKAAKAIAGNNMEVRNYAEDYVQDAYLKLSRYDDLYDRIINKEGKATKGYMFFALRSVIINSIKKKTNLKFDHKGDLFEMDYIFNFEDLGIDKQFVKINNLEEKMLETLQKKVAWFDYELFKLYMKSGKSFQTIAEETKLGVQTIYLSIKKCKLTIAEELFEDYVKYLGDE